MAEIKKKDTKIRYESITDDNSLRIIMNDDEIIFFVVLGLPSFNYIKTYKYNEIIKELNIPECKDIEEVYDFIMKSKYRIIDEEKKVIINNNKEIHLKEISKEYGELIKILMDEIKELKEQNYKFNEKINEIIKKNKDREIKMNKLEKKLNELNKKINELEENKKDKETINLIYRVKEEGTYNIFGKDFVEKNKDNIELKINGNKTNLVNKTKLNKGDNTIKMIIKNKINEFQLKDITELKYLNTKHCNNFTGMFSFCSSLSDIKALEKWDVSNVNNFSGMFSFCKSLSDIKPLENWNVGNGNNFSFMFAECLKLSDIKPLEKWNVSKGNNFDAMLDGCLSLSDYKPLEKWNVSKPLLKNISRKTVNIFSSFDNK